MAAQQGDSCEDLIIKQVIIGGADGEKGDTGPPGSSLTLPIPAADISVTNSGFANAQEIFDFLLYDPLLVNLYADATLFENRASTDPSADFTLQFNWTYNKTIVSQTFVGPVEMTPVSPVANDRAVTVTLTNFNTAATFTLEGDDGEGAPVQDSVNVGFTNKIYWGDSAIPGAIDSNFILSLGNIGGNSLQPTNTIAVGSDTTATTFFWFCHPVAYGIPALTVGGFQLDQQTPVLVSFTNNLGYTEDYNVIRATNSNLGSITVDIN